MKIITAEAALPHLSWPGAVEALRAGHRLPKAESGDLFMGQPESMLMARAARIPGLGQGVKTFTVTGANPARGLPAVQGGMLLFEEETGAPRALVDFQLVTGFKTAADSVLGGLLLARPDPKRVLVVGAGEVAKNLLQAWPALFPSIERIDVWARRAEAAEALAQTSPLARAAPDLAAAAGAADIVSTATMSRDPVLKGEWIRPGTHIDLIGAYTPEMREADDAMIAAGPLYVDSRESAAHIGEVTTPMATGALAADAIRGDLYEMIAARPARDAGAITLYKNAGGAHLDLMIADWIARAAG